MQFLGEKLFCKLNLHHTHEDGVVNVGFLYRSGHFIQFLAKPNAGKEPLPTSVLLVRAKD